MGYSAAAAAFRTLEKIEEQHGQRIYNGLPGGFWEIGKEQRDGAIIGDVWKFTEPSQVNVVKAGRFRIEPDGLIKRFPLLPVTTRNEINTRLTSAKQAHIKRNHEAWEADTARRGVQS